MSEPAIVKVPVKGSDQDLEIKETAGKCGVVTCKVSGGGLLRVTLADPINEEMSFTKHFVICGGCLQTVLGNSLVPAKRPN